MLASTLLGVNPPELPTRSLIATAELLGISPGTARVALSRMAAAGEVEATGGGYRLVGPLLARQQRQDLSRTGLPAGPGDPERWTMVVVVGEARSATDRTDLRAALHSLRHAERREGVWLRPDNLPAEGQPAARAVVAAQTERYAVRPEDPTALAAQLWDLDGWAGAAEALHSRLTDLAEPLEAGEEAALAPAFVANADALRHLQADPLLPAALLPASWPGDLLRSQLATFDATFKHQLTTWLQHHLRS